MNEEQLEEEIKKRKIVAAINRRLFYMTNSKDRPYPTNYCYEDQRQELKQVLKDILK